ncbi:hypothetical protein Ddye_028086 [Dipteronia dyeriana]|uniref:Transposase MuDR plant domain-containing protein n=1 Tax=Dipteronia dyeriana TaxID=168575 RepID=A0AAD9WR39_9ROSI|nr:hypothetical protein Ddye_028086 [Dipteronia dyeriana]
MSIIQNQVDNVGNNEDNEELVQMERPARRLQRFSSNAPDIAGTSEVHANVTPDDSDNALMWVIPGAKSYSFGIGGSRNLDEPTCMIYKGQFFPTKKDLKRLVEHFAMQHNFEWKMKRSNKITLYLVCLMDNCKWKLRAVRRDNATYFQCNKDGKFLYFFMSLGASFRAFLRCMCQVIAVDDTLLKGRFGGTMFVATVQDGNE